MDQSSYAELVAARLPALLRLAVMLTGSRLDAEDLVQSTLLKAQRHGDRIARMDAPAAYLRQVLVNEHLSWRRTLGRRVHVTPLLGDVAGPDPTAGVDQRDETWQLLAGLPRRQRTVLALRYYDDLPDAEIARLLGCSEGTVRSHASRALATLRAHLTETEVHR